MTLSLRYRILFTLVPFLALASVLVAGHDHFQLGSSVLAVLGGIVAIVAVLAVGRWLLRPLFHEIAHSRLRPDETRESSSRPARRWLSLQRRQMRNNRSYRP